MTPDEALQKLTMVASAHKNGLTTERELQGRIAEVLLQLTEGGDE